MRVVAASDPVGSGARRDAAAARACRGAGDGTRCRAAGTVGADDLQGPVPAGDVALEVGEAGVEVGEPRDPLRDLGSTLRDEPRQFIGRIRAVARMAP